MTKEDAIEILQVIQKEMRRIHRSGFVCQLSDVIKYLETIERE